MATIIQVNRVNTNRVNARTDTISQLQGSTALTGGALDAIHIPNLPATRINSGTFDAGRIPSLNASIINAGTISASRLPLGSNFQIQSDGTIRANPINLSDVHTFATPVLRNAGLELDGVTPIDWHEGDIAIVTTGGEVPGSSTDTGFTVAFGPNNGVNVANGWDPVADASLLPFVTGAIINAYVAGTTNFRAAADGTIYTWEVVDIRQSATTPTTAEVIFSTTSTIANRTGNQSLGGGDHLVLPGAPGGNVDAGTWIYTADDATGPTINDNWTLLQVPGSSISTLGSSERTIQPNGIPVGVTGTAATGLTVIPANIFPSMTMFPTAFYLYVNGIKIAASEITVANDRTSFTLGSAVLFPPSSETNRGLTFEITFLS